MTDPVPEPVSNPSSGPRSGFRLDRLELYNWGTFHDRVRIVDLHCQGALLTGDIGSGKSTVVDAITTLLVAPQRQQYNKAAGAEARERSLRSYVLGYYKTERGDSGPAGRPVQLRDATRYSVILARFFDARLGQHVTLAQVFWMDSPDGQPARLLVVADAPLTIADHFGGFGSEVAALKKRLKKLRGVECHETFPPYSAAFRRRLGIDTDQALELFHQTVSMKSIGNLTDFVRAHMLEPFPVEDRILALLRHFDALVGAHAAVKKARDQIDRLAPLVADCDRHATLTEARADLDACRIALPGWFASLRRQMLEARIGQLEQEIGRLATIIGALKQRQAGDGDTRDQLKRDIAAAGGSRLERLRADIASAEKRKREREGKARSYDDLVRSVDLPRVSDAAVFAANLRRLDEERRSAAEKEVAFQNERTERAVEMSTLRAAHTEVDSELRSLRAHPSNIPRRMLEVRANLCAQLGVGEEALPFAGELLEVRSAERDWEGAIERVLHGFGLSLLVGDDHYSQVPAWVDRTHLGERLVYFRVKEPRRDGASTPGPQSLVKKLSIRPESPFYPWLEAELARRFDFTCCRTIEEFRRATQAVTQKGQTKTGGERHEKDDRHAIGDRSRYVLGWSNERKIAALDAQRETLERQIASLAARIAKLDGELAGIRERDHVLAKLSMFRTFEEIDWRGIASEIERLKEEKRQIESSSDALRTLELQLAAVDKAIAERGREIEERQGESVIAGNERDRSREQIGQCELAVERIPEPERLLRFPRLSSLREEALGRVTLLLEKCDEHERAMRKWLDARLEKSGRDLGALGQSIVKAMESYRKDYSQEAHDADAALEAAPEYRGMLERLRGDDLPRFEARFKQILDENTLREIAGFQSQLARERETIKDRIARINGSLRQIDYNPGRYIELAADATLDADVRDFQSELRACTEGTLGASGDPAFAERKFLEIVRLLSRLRGREGTTELDRQWTKKVTDVRNWYTFSATERWREDGAEHEFYAGSGGKSGGQKEKIAYTVLAASLAYQFGLDAPSRPRTFRFVVIDEAFGRGSDESTRYALALFGGLDVQLLVVTPLQKIRVIEPYVAAVAFVHNDDGRDSKVRNLTIEEYRAEQAARAG